MAADGVVVYIQGPLIDTAAQLQTGDPMRLLHCISTPTHTQYSTHTVAQALSPDIHT